MGPTPEDALHNAYDAIEAWLEAARDLGRDLPEPSQKLAFLYLTEIIAPICIKFPAGLLL
jgi:predicted RNase H-like HicB family nuclease